MYELGWLELDDWLEETLCSGQLPLQTSPHKLMEAVLMCAIQCRCLCGLTFSIIICLVGLF